MSLSNEIVVALIYLLMYGTFVALWGTFRLRFAMKPQRSNNWRQLRPTRPEFVTGRQKETSIEKEIAGKCQKLSNRSKFCARNLLISGA